MICIDLIIQILFLLISILHLYFIVTTCKSKVIWHQHHHIHSRSEFQSATAGEGKGKASAAT